LTLLPSPALEGGGGQLADNVLHFTRVLRKAGLPIGTDRPLLALQALQIAGVSSRIDLYAVLRACLIDRIEHRALFDQAFRVFWSDPERLEEILRLLLPPTPGRASVRPGPSERLREALGSGAARWPQRAEVAPERVAVDGQMSSSDREQLRKVDFDSMTSAEWSAALRVIAALAPLLARVATRRDARSSHAVHIDLQRLLRDCARRGMSARCLWNLTGLPVCGSVHDPGPPSIRPEGWLGAGAALGSAGQCRSVAGDPVLLSAARLMSRRLGGRGVLVRG